MKELVRSLMRPPALAMRGLGLTPPETVFKHLHRTGPFDIRLPKSRRTFTLMSWGERVENELFWRGWIGHEPEVMRWWARLALQSKAVLDIGANTGCFAFMAKALNPEATVHAFEPVARIAERIGENCSVSGLDVEVFQKAVANEVAELMIHDPGGTNAYSASLDVNFLPGDKESYLVPVTTIDNHCAEVSLQPDLIEVDVEGIEGRLLLGARQTLMDCCPVIVCEWTRNSAEHDAARELLANAGYAVIDPATGQQTTLDVGREHDERNVIFCPKEQVEELRALGPL